MKLSHTMLYALQATIQLAEAGPSSPVPCSRLAEQGNMPERFLLQILRSLVNRKLLCSTRGVDGGYTLLLPPDQITLYDLFETFDTHHELDPAKKKVHLSPESWEKLEATMTEINDIARDKLSSVTLADFLDNAEEASAKLGDDISLSK